MEKLINHQNSYGGTPFYAAAQRGPLDMVGTLLNAGADIGAPLMAACAAGRLLTVKTLVAKCARTSYTNVDGITKGSSTGCKEPS